MVGGGATRPVRVRPAVRRLLFWVGPVLLLIATWQMWDAIEATQLRAEITRAFPEGLIEPQVSWEDDNAARYYTAASAAVLWPSDTRVLSSAVLWDTRDSLARGEPPSVPGSAEAFELVSKNRLSIDLVEQAGGLPFGAFRPGTEFNYRFGGLLEVGQLSALKTLDAVRRGDAAVSVASVIARLKLLRAFDAEGRLYGASQVGAELREIATDTALLLVRTGPSDALLGELSRALSEIAETDVDRVIRRESIARYEGLQVALGERPSSPFVVGLFMIRPVLRHHAVGTMQVAADARQAARLPWPDRIAAMNAIPERRSALPEAVQFIGPWRLQSQFRDMVPRVGIGVAAARCARLAVALEQHRRKRGAFPPSLNELEWHGSAGDLVDPFTGKPLVYVLTTAGYVLYSLGPNAKDDGGYMSPQPARGRPPGTGPTPDIGVRVGVKIRPPN